MSNVLIITGDQASLEAVRGLLDGNPKVKAAFAENPEAQPKRSRQAFEYMEAKLIRADQLIISAREESARSLALQRQAEEKLADFESRNWTPAGHCPKCSFPGPRREDGTLVQYWDEEEPIDPNRKPMIMESRAGCWVSNRLGEAHADPIERAARVFEESCEFAQAAKLPKGMARRILRYVYTRHPGDATSEAASVAVTLMAWLCFTGTARLQKLAVAELDRIEALPQEKIDASLQRKMAAGIVTVQPKVEPDKPEAPELSQAALDDVTEEAIKKLEAADLSPEDFLSYWQRKKRWQERNIR